MSLKFLLYRAPLRTPIDLTLSQSLRYRSPLYAIQRGGDRQNSVAVHSPCFTQPVVDGDRCLSDEERRVRHGRAGSVVLCAGVVFGDIGTSPLYALQVATRAASPTAAIAPEAVLGIVSLVFWALIVIISIKYAVLIMRATNHGEGGILALLALVSPQRAEQSAPCRDDRYRVDWRHVAVWRWHHHTGDLCAKRD